MKTANKKDCAENFETSLQSLEAIVRELESANYYRYQQQLQARRTGT